MEPVNQALTPYPGKVIPEMELLLLCARPNQDQSTQARIQQLYQSGLDWARLHAYCEYHRLHGLVYHRSNKLLQALDMPAEQRSSWRQFEQGFRHSLNRRLRQAAQVKQVGPALQQQGIANCLIKGWALVNLLYDNITQRQSHDVDVLVKSEDVAAAAKLFREMGYTLYQLPPDFDLHSELGRHYIKTKQEMAFVSPSGDFVDLHWKLSRNFAEFPLPEKTLWKDIENQYRLSGRYQLSLSLHFVYLCYHGGKHQWLRLHWLGDVARLLVRADELLNWDEVLTIASDLGVLPSVITAQCLCFQLLGVAVASSNYDKKLLASCQARALRQIPEILQSQQLLGAQPHYGKKLLELYQSTRNQTQWRYRLLVCGYLFTPTASEISLIRLPDRLYILYYLIRPIRLSYRVLTLGGKQLLSRLRVSNG